MIHIIISDEWEISILSSGSMAGLQKALAFESRQSREHFAVRRRLHQLQNAQAKQGLLPEPWGAGGAAADSEKQMACGKMSYV